MFIVTIEQEEDDDFFGHWILRATWASKGEVNVTQAMYEALYCWIKDNYGGSTYECLQEIAIDDHALRITVSHVEPPGRLVKVLQERFIPLDRWAGGRTVNFTPAHCAICDWYGPIRGMIHAYRLTSQAEIEPIDLCPQCNTVLS